MKIESFLSHHNIRTNPFADEDAQTDPVFKEFCIGNTYHPSWDKIYGEPLEPATSIVFGEKGSGKTALRLQIVARLREHNRQHPDQRAFVIEYDDLNPFLDRFRGRLSGRRRRADRALGEWKLWDHMDAILSLGVTKLADAMIDSRRRTNGHDDAAESLDPTRLDRHQARDLLLLAACYDQSLAVGPKHRWQRLKRKVRFSTWKAHLDQALGIAVTLAVAGVVIASQKWEWLTTPWPYLIAAAGWGWRLWRTWKWFWKARSVSRQLRVLHREVNPLRRILMKFPADDIVGQPLPNKPRTDDRYELLAKFQGLLRALGYSGIIVLVDRVDEPHLVNGSAEQMRTLIWPLLDNKFLKHPGVGLKLLLPVELEYFIEREDRDFYQRARLDKQNMVPSLQWTGEALYDVANARVKACAADGATPTLRDLFDESITDRRLIDALRELRVPRHLFKFMYRVLVAHSSAYTEENPKWRISAETFESALAVYRRNQDAFDRGMAAG